MAKKDSSHREVLFSDVPGDEDKVRLILTEWGIEERAINRILREARTQVAQIAIEQDSLPQSAPPRASLTN